MVASCMGQPHILMATGSEIKGGQNRIIGKGGKIS